MSSQQLPKGWSLVESRSQPGNFYYFNERTGEKTWDPPSADSGEEVRCLHILKKHEKSRRPASWRNPNITQTKDEAINQIQEIRGRLLEKNQLEGPNVMALLFAEIARTESDCSSAQNGGDLGSFARGQMQKPFEDASFALPVGGLSDIVDSDSGIHVILRVA
mmetsp:Transcript_35753/g.36460  ORF Transcript_35753/g.36460 Transcript_35753/m.36460 type:complete len:163 (+) Transcript_35753:50-538(+)